MSHSNAYDASWTLVMEHKVTAKAPWQQPKCLPSDLQAAGCSALIKPDPSVSSSQHLVSRQLC